MSLVEDLDAYCPRCRHMLVEVIVTPPRRRSYIRYMCCNRDCKLYREYLDEAGLQPSWG